MKRALIVAAPQTGSGKTTVTLGLLAALRRAGHPVGAAKVGPDYIDPAFLAAACGRACPNLDGWSMRPAMLDTLGAGLDGDPVLIEGVMGLFDGAPAGGTFTGATTDGSTAALARRWRLPVLLVIDARGLAASAAALLFGFSRFDPDVRVAGVLFNRVGSARHGAILREAAARAGLPVLGLLPEAPQLTLRSRHLGLVQASEHGDLAAFLTAAAEHVAGHADLAAIMALAEAPALAAGRAAPVAPPGRRVAVATDDAFRFAYPHLLDGWRAAGAAVLPFSPLEDEAVPEAADAVFLPGGYPELHAARLSAADRFLGTLRAAAAAGVAIRGECGGYMVLGRQLIDADGGAHAMAGILPVTTSFAVRRRSLGYRLAVRADGRAIRGHEFHYATVVEGADAGEPLFVRMLDAGGQDLGPAGHRAGRVEGSFLHVVDEAVD